MESLIIVIHVLAAIGVTVLVLMQRGKGADMGASFGSGASGTMFGAVGSGNVLTKATTILAVVFFATSLSMAMFARQKAELNVVDDSLISNLDQVTAELSVPEEAPADMDVPQVVTESDASNDVPSLLEESTTEE